MTDSKPTSRSLWVREGDRFRATEASTGPWSRDGLHGGPVAALFAHLLEHEPGGEAMFPARMTVELLRPVGHQPVTVSVGVVRPGKKVRVLDATLSLADAPDGAATSLARATLQQIRSAPVPLPVRHREIDPDETPPLPTEAAPVTTSRFFATEWPAFHNTAVEHRSPDDFFGNLGPAFDWIRVHADLFPGLPLSSFARVAAAADFGNGVSATLPVGEYLFVNPDLTIVLDRLPEDEWVGLDARTRVGASGVAYAESVLFDRRGRIGRSIQTLLVDKTV